MKIELFAIMCFRIERVTELRMGGGGAGGGGPGKKGLGRLQEAGMTGHKQ